MDYGIVYIATGEQYLEETKRSVDSLREHMSDVPVTLITDTQIDYEGIDDVIVQEDPSHSYADGIIDLDDIPYDRTLRLDSDTFISGDLEELFMALDRFEFGASINPGRRYYAHGSEAYVPEDVPESFPLVNGGVLLFKKNDRVENLFDSWKNIYYDTLEENEPRFNQPSLREALYKSDVRFFPIPREYNCWILLSGYVYDEVKIVHGRHPDLERIAEILNNRVGPRCYDKSSYPINVSSGRPPGDERLDYRLRKAINQEGLAMTARKGLNKLFDRGE